MSAKVGVNIERQDFSNKIKYEVRHSTPIDPLLKHAEFMRGKEEFARKVRNNEIEPMCALGPVEVMQIKSRHGIDVMNLKGNDGEALKFIIETEFPYLKTTNKKLYRRGGKGQKGMHFGAK